jgi:hypothetical protein
MKKFLATITAAGLLTLGAAGTAFAAPTDPGAGSADKPAATQEQGQHRGLRRAAIKTAAEAAAATIGVQVSDLKAALQSGQTVAALAESKGVSAQSVVDAVVKAIDDRIDQAVTDGKVTADRAAKAKAKVPALADRLVNTVPKRFQAPAPAPAG